MDRRLAAIVTGSVGGIGYAMADALAATGVSVMLNGLCNGDEGAQAARLIAEQHDVEAAFDPADLNNADEIGRMVSDVEARWGGIDILVNNAVVRHFAPVEEMDPADWDQSIAVNLTAAFHTIRLALPGMKRRGWGRIVNLTSYYGARGASERVDYVTTKTALIGLTRAVAIEAASFGVTCNAICPGSVLTPAIEARLQRMAEEEGRDADQLARDYAAARNPMGRFVKMESIGAMLAFLCGPGGADVNGAVLPVDGGWLAL